MAMFEYPELLFIIPLIAYLFYLLRRRGKTLSHPTNWPVIGMLPAAIQNVQCVFDYLTKVLIESGGTYEFKGPLFCNLDMVLTSDPANIHHVCSRNFSNYPKGPEFRKIFEVMGDGIFNADFELWEIHRKTTLSQLTHANFSTALERTVWRKVETGLLPVLDYFCKQGRDLDLQDIFNRFAFDNICELMLDHDPRSLSIELPHIPCEKAFSIATQPLLLRHIIPESIWKLQRWLKIGSEKKLTEAFEAFNEFIAPHINLSNGEHENGYNILKAFEKVYEEKNIASSGGLRGFLKDTLLSLIFAGRDTTSTCLTWLFWLLALNPSALIKIREEIETQLLHKKEDRKWRFFSAEESSKLIYLHGALCESLRLFPPLPLEHKAPVRADTLPSGHYLRENSKLIISFYSVGRMESVWGKDCLEFKPERWISPKGEIKHEPSYKFPAFNAGPRTCLGKGMAFVQMKMVAAAIIYHYNIKLVDGHLVSPHISVILHAKDGVKVRLSKRN